jgi:hypothetical protein
MLPFEQHRRLPLPNPPRQSSSSSSSSSLSCGHYVSDRNRFLPDDMQYLVDSVWSTIMLRSESSLYNDDNDKSIIVGSVHVRQGDTTHLCDTTVPRVRSYLDCSLCPLLLSTDKNNENIKMTIILLFASDERDPIYRNDLLISLPSHK